MLKSHIQLLMLTTIFSTQLSLNAFSMHQDPSEDPSRKGTPTRQPKRIIVNTNSPEFKALEFYDRHIREREGVDSEEELDEYEKEELLQNKLPEEELARLRSEWNLINLGQYRPSINVEREKKVKDRTTPTTKRTPDQVEELIKKAHDLKVEEEEKKDAIQFAIQDNAKDLKVPTNPEKK